MITNAKFKIQWWVSLLIQRSSGKLYRIINESNFLKNKYVYDIL